jgi:phytol kinase
MVAADPRQFLGVLAVATWLAVLALLAVAVRRLRPERSEWSRKLVHIGAGPVVLIAWWFGIGRGIAVPAAATVTLLAALNHLVRVLPAIEDVGRRSYGTIAYGASITLLLWWWWPHHPDTVAAGVLVMALGDGSAGLIGPAIVSPSWTVLGERRSLAGTAAMAIASLAVLACLALTLAGAGIARPTAMELLAITAAAVTLEQIAFAGIDNLTVPLAVAALWRLAAQP